MTVFVLFFLPLLVSLGLWQSGRAAQKRAMSEAYLDALTRLPVTPEYNQAPADFKRLKLVGEFTEEVYFVDNQVHQGRPGYALVQGFDTTAGKYLVNRGFVPAPLARDVLPGPDTPSGQLTLIGVVWPFTGLLPVLDEDVWHSGWPKRVQRLDVSRMAEEIDAIPVEVRLEAGQTGVQQAASLVNLLSDDTHRGYAATWFSLAAALVVLYGIYGRKRHRQMTRGAKGTSTL